MAEIRIRKKKKSHVGTLSLKNKMRTMWYHSFTERKRCT